MAVQLSKFPAMQANSKVKARQGIGEAIDDKEMRAKGEAEDAVRKIVDKA